MQKTNPVLAAIHAERGTAGKLAKHLGITRNAVFMWKNVPPRHAQTVAKIMKMPLHVVCPKVWTAPPKRKKAAPHPSSSPELR